MPFNVARHSPGSSGLVEPWGTLPHLTAKRLDLRPILISLRQSALFHLASPCLQVSQAELHNLTATTIEIPDLIGCPIYKPSSQTPHAQDYTPSEIVTSIS